MKKVRILINSFILGLALFASAAPGQVARPPAVEAATGKVEKTAAHEVSSEADKWAATKKADKPTMAEEAAAEETSVGAKERGSEGEKVQAKKRGSNTEAKEVSSEAVKADPLPAHDEPPVTSPPVKVAAPAVKRTDLNEMKGKLNSISYDPKTLRLIADGGFNVELTFDARTSLVDGGERIRPEDLSYNDEIIVRYSGKELYAVEVERVSKAARPE